MNKAEIDKMLPKAYELLSKNGIADKSGNIVKTYRGQISSFGAAITGGSLLSAIAFFSDKGGSDVDRPALMKCIAELVHDNKSSDSGKMELFDYVLSNKNNQEECKERILNAALALKLAMNLYNLK